MYRPINTRIVLVETSHPGNIGSAARAMKTMGLHDLVLVRPKRFPASEATMMAAGADDIVIKAKVVETLDEAINDCEFIMGTSARDRSLPWPLVNPEQGAKRLLSHSGQTAILFGREDKGLKNEELQRCHYHVQIPANPEYSSLNLAQAVQVLTYQLRMCVEQPKDEEHLIQGYDAEVADSQTMELFYQHLDKTLHDIEFLNPDNPNRVMPRLRRIINRSRPDVTELNILRGILSKMQWHVKPRKPG